ncbi:MAG: signal peptidase I [Chthoniobacterales bacterium]
MFFKPRYVKEAQNYLQAARRIQRYRADVLPPEDYAQLDDAIRGLERASRERKPDAVRERITQLDRLVGRIAPPRSHAGWRENCEVILVAIVIAAGVRAYLLEPFKIPTGSMQVTLYGIIGQPEAEPPPNFIKRAFDFVVGGRTHFNLVAKDDEQVLGMREYSRANYFTFTKITTDKNSYTVFAPIVQLRGDFGVREGRIYKKDQPIVRGTIDNGDFVLVNKLGYNFFPPQRSDVFVFKTTDIELIERGIPDDLGSQHYIKRLAGLPGDQLRIDPPNIYVNGKLGTEKMFGRVMSLEDGYGGYTNGGGYMNHLTAPDESFTVPPHSYFALGDNSGNSSDSRYWGIVPERNVTGKAFAVFWPITKRWGFVE